MRGGTGLREGLATRAAAVRHRLRRDVARVVGVHGRAGDRRHRAGGAGAVALAVIARVVPGALAGPFTALLADRRLRRAILLGLTDGARRLVHARAAAGRRVLDPHERPAARAGGAPSRPRATRASSRSPTACVADGRRAVKLVGLGTGGVGTLNSAWGAGGLIGGFGALMLLARGRFATALDANAALIAAPPAIVAVAAAPAVAVIGFAVLGLGYALARPQARR